MFIDPNPSFSRTHPHHESRTKGGAPGYKTKHNRTRIYKQFGTAYTFHRLLLGQRQQHRADDHLTTIEHFVWVVIEADEAFGTHRATHRRIPAGHPENNKAPTHTLTHPHRQQHLNWKVLVLSSKTDADTDTDTGGHGWTAEWTVRTDGLDGPDGSNRTNRRTDGQNSSQQHAVERTKCVWFRNGYTTQ